MKKILAMSTICLFLIAGSAYADIQSYELRLGSAITGNTTVPSGGVSVMAVATGTNILKSGTSEIPTGRDSGYGVFEISGITVSQVQQAAGGDYTDNTFSIFYRTVLINANAHCDCAERKRLFFDTKLSGSTKYSKPFSFPPGSFIKFYFDSSGVTAYDSIQASLFLGLPDFDYKIDTTKTYCLYLGTADSGNSTQHTPGTGVSNLIVDGGKYVRSESTYIIDGMDEVVTGYCIFQIDELTICDAQQNYGGDYSGATLNVRYKESLIDDTIHWDAASAVTIVPMSVAMSGNTKIVYPFAPDLAKYIRFEFISGITAYDNLKAKVSFKIGD